MRPYLTTYKFYYDGEQCGEHSYIQLLESAHNEEISGVDFDSLWDLTSKYCWMMPLGMWEFKKGKRFLQFQDVLISRITKNNCKPWRLVITSKETTISMRELMSFDSERVIQYLKERGATVCPIMKGE